MKTDVEIDVEIELGVPVSFFKKNTFVYHREDGPSMVFESGCVVYDLDGRTLDECSYYKAISK